MPSQVLVQATSMGMTFGGGYERWKSLGDQLVEAAANKPDAAFTYNNEDFGPDSLLGRASDREVVLTRILRDKLAERNPGVPDEAYDDAVRQITATVASQTIAATNREKHDLVRDGVQVTFRNDKGERVREYNQENDRVAIEKTFEDLLRLANDLDDEERRAVREGLDEESLAIFDLLKKDGLTAADIKRLKKVASDLLETLKTEKLRIDQWREKESTRDAVRVAISDFLWSDQTGLPVDCFEEVEVQDRAEEIFRHVYRVYPTIPSPYFGTTA